MTRATKKKSKQHSKGSKSSSSKSNKSNLAQEKYAKRSQEALERCFDQAQRKAQPPSAPPASGTQDPDTQSQPIMQQTSAEIHVPPVTEPVSQQPNWAQPSTAAAPPMAPQPPRRLPEATFTPTAAGLRPPEGAHPTYYDVQAMISDTLSRMLTTGFPQGNHPPCSHVYQPIQSGHSDPGRPLVHCPEADTGEYSPHGSDHSDDSQADYEDTGEMDLSEDETSLPDRPAFPGLFRPSLFKALLHKAITTTQLAAAKDPPQQQGDPIPHEALFAVPKTDQQFIPCPQLFSEVVQRPWSQPGSPAAPNGIDKKLFCSAPSLQELLELPAVDAPIAALTSSAVLSNDIADGLRSEDRKAELVCRKSHQTAAWAIRAATSASFFNRASLIWLRQLQERLPPEDRRLHQDINKLVAATEYSADAALAAAKFSSRSLVSNVTSRRLLWLRHWRGDAKSKWKLASAPYKGSRLFGEALDPILIEDKDKRKIMPTSFRRTDRRFSPYLPRQPFRTDPGSSGAASYRPSSYSFDRPSDRSNFRDRSRRQQPAKRPFRGSGSRPFRRGK